MIPYGRQSLDQADIDAVVEVLQSDWLTQGPTIERFEQAMAERCQADFAVAVCNATAALHIACLAAGLGAGDACGPRRTPFSRRPTAGVIAALTLTSSTSIR